MKTTTCFVISPIGQKESETRKLADDVYDLIIQPALDKYSIQVTRADKISSVGSITSEVVELVQESDLCIIDITGHNPNVMYECGRRHETGKPYVMIAREGEQLPFDINTIRTIFYDLKNPREIRSVIVAIQDIVSKLLQQGFSPVTAGDSLASLSDAIRRIERTLGTIVTSANASRSTGSATTNASEILKKLGPIDAIRYAATQRDPELFDELLPKIRPRVDKERFVTEVLPAAASIGSRVAIEMLKATLVSLDTFKTDELRTIVGSYLTGLGMYDREAEALEQLEGFFDSVSRGEKPEGATPKDRAFFLNQKQRLLHGLRRHEEATQLGEQVLALAPNDQSYLFNQSINYEYVRDDPKCVDLVDRYMALIYADKETIPDDDHLSRAVKVYARAGHPERAKEAFQMLRQHHPLKAAILADQSDIERILTAQ